MNKKIFKAYDIRGFYPKEINEEIVRDIACVIVRRFIPKNKKPHSVVVGHDVRLSSKSLYESVIEGVAACGNKIEKIHRAGLITTPMLDFLVNDLNASIGIMITASHNPKINNNGLKVVGGDGLPISGLDILSKL